MQVAAFTSGGFVLHRVRVAGSRMRFSAWYAADGTLLGHEGFDVRNRARQVRGVAVALQAIGRRYAAAAAAALGVAS